MKTEPILLALLCVLGSHAYSRDDDSDEVNLERPQFVLDKQTFSRRAYDQAKPPREAESLSGQDLIDYVNARQNLWTAKVQPRIQGMSQRAIQSLMGVKDVESNITIEKNISETRFLDIKIPKSFDARKKWPKCKSIKNIRDQSSCGSCWAFGAVEAMSDRICIASKGKIQVTLSADDLLSCCRFCGPGCKGGKPILAWHYWMWNGIVTGSNHELNQGCKPYPFPTCEHISNKTHYPHCKHDFYPTPKCTKTCQSEYKKSYKADKFYGKNAYHIDSSVEAIQKELITHGPIEVAFEVYEDFLSYNGGVYVNQGGKFKGRHAVKLIGWGVDNTVPYWLVANSWNTDWGEKGFFKILRGVNECGIESGGVAGIPKLDTSDFDLEDDLD